MGVAIPGGGFVEDRASGALVVDGSLRFAQSNTQYLTRTPSSNGDRTRWTVSLWCKRHSLGGGSGGLRSIIHTNAGSQETILAFWSDDAIFFWDYNSAYTTQLKTVGVAFRDVSSWYHIVLSVDTTQSTDTERIKLYVNNVRQIFTNVAPHGYIAQNTQTRWNSALISQISGGYYKNDCSITNIYNIDGQALDSSYFGYTDALTNTWRPKKFKQETTTNGSYSINQIGRVFSTGISGSQDNSDGGGSNAAFNGSIANISNQGSYPNPGSTLTWTAASSSLGTTLPYTSTARVYVGVDINGEAGGLTVVGANGSQTISTGVAGNAYGWVSITAATSPITSIAWSRAGGGSQGVRLYAVEIDGQILIDGAGFGLNGFYLPFDGNSPIGQDQSGRGNNWTPVNFGGSNTLEKATGALPILNTDGGGKVARVGVRTDSSASSLVLALPLVGIKSDFSNAVNSGTSNKAITANGDAAASSAQSNFYGGSFAFDGTGDYLQTTVETLSGDFCVEGWWYPSSSGQQTFFTLGDAATSTGIQLYRSSGTSNLIIFGSAGSIISSGVDYTLNKWQHFALTRSGTSLRLFKDGIQIGSTVTNSTAFNSTLRIGVEFYSSTLAQYLTGYIQDFRVYTTAKYTQNFIPASTDPDILPDTPSGVSYTSNLTQITDGAVAFDGSGDELTLSSTSDFTFATNNYTIECFVYYTATSSGYVYDFRSGDANAPALSISSGTLYAGGAGNNMTVSNIITTGKWYHIALVRNSNTETIYIDGIAYNTQSNSNNLAQTALSIGNRYAATFYYHSGFISNLHVVKGTALYTSNFTPPTGPISSVANTKLLCCQSNSNPKLSPVGPNVGLSTSTRFNTNFETIPTTVNGISVTNNGSVSTTSAGTNSFGFTNGANFTGSNSLSVNLGSVPNLTTIDLIFKVNGTVDNKYLFGLSNSGLVRRSSSSFAWHNGDTDQIVSSTPDDGVWHHLRVTPTDLYFDGTRIQNTTSLPNIATNSNGYMAIGAYRNDSGTIQYNGAVIFGLVRVMPGVDLGAPTVPITTNGSLSSSETIPTDGVIIRVGNAAATNFNPFTANINTQRGKQSGYATLNPLAPSGGTFSNGNLDWASPATDQRIALSSISISTSGKWYCEYTIGSKTGTYWSVGIFGNPATWSPRRQYRSDGPLFDDSSQIATFSSFTQGDVMGLTFDSSTSVVSFYKNGILQGTSTASPTAATTSYYFGCTSDSSGGSMNYSANFGQKPFKFPPPAGFQPLALANTPRPTIVRPDQYVGVSTWSGAQSGSGGLTRQISLGMQPDFVWIKQRNQAYSTGHQLYDSVRGAGAEKELNSSGTAAEGAGNIETYGWLNSFDKTGFTVKGGSSDYDYVDKSGVNYVAWAWKAGGNSNTYNINDVGYATASAAGLTAGSITPTGASVNTKSGFSIITYNGAGTNSALTSTISHGLTQSPTFMIVKARTGTNAADDWFVYHKSIGPTKRTRLNLTNAADTQTWMGDTEPTSSLITLNQGWYSVNYTGHTHILYAWTEIPGFSKFGSYVGNLSTDGPVVNCNFRPRIVLIKRSTSDSSGGNWILRDAERSKFNPTQINLFPNLAIAETTEYDVDFLSNGFKIRSNNVDINNNGGTFIFAAFAETPTQNLYGAQANAR